MQWGTRPQLGLHPQRTPFYGMMMILSAFIAGLWVHDLPNAPLQVIVYLILFAIAIVGFVMTFRDFSY